MTLIFVRIKPLKLGNRELAKYWDRLYNQSKIQFGFTHLTKNTEKAAYIKKYHQYIELRIQEEKFRSLCDRAALDTNDFKLITTGVNRDLTLLEEAIDRGLEERINSLPQKAKTVTQGKDIKEQIAELTSLTKEEFDQKSSSTEFESILDMSMAIEVDPDTMELSGETIGTQTETLVTTVDNEQQTEHSVITVESQTESSGAESGPMEIDGTLNKSVKCYQVNAEMKLDTGSSIPLWKKASNSLDETRNLRQYIRDLLRFKKLKLLENEAVLINASLVKSGRTDVYAEMPKDAEENVEKFIKYLRTAYGLSAVEMLKELQSIKQESGESPHTFLSRVVNLYYEARNEAKKTLEDIQSNPIETNEIIRLYLAGLRDPRVRIAVRSRLDDLNLTKIAKATRNAQMALKESNSLSVNHVAANQGTSVDGISDKLHVMNINSNKKFNQNSKNFKPWSQQKSYSNQQKSYSTQRYGKNEKPDKRMIECFKCRKVGHYARDCRSGDSNRTGQGYTKSNYSPKGAKPITKFSCYNCGKPNHYAKDCRSKKSNKRN